MTSDESPETRVVDTGSDTLLCEVRDRVGLVTLNRSEILKILCVFLRLANTPRLDFERD